MSRLWAYLNERFPPAVYSFLVLLFWASAAGVSAAFTAEPFPWHSAPIMLVVWAVFLHLRLFDEHKDADVDRLAYPDRLLSRSVVTLPLLWRFALVTIVFESIVSAWMGVQVLAVWGLTFAFTLAMRFEFGVGAWLSARMVLYALTHNPVVALLGFLCWSATGYAWSASFGAYLLMVSLSSLVFELARKIRLPEEELAEVPSYSSTLGRSKAIALVRGVGLLSVGVGTGLIWLMASGHLIALGLGVALHVCALVALVLFSKPMSKASQVEVAGSLFLLLQLLACIVGGLSI